MGINHITLIGHVQADPEARRTQAGIAQTTFEVAVARSPRLDGTASEAVDTFRVVAWRTLAETLGETLHRGDLISLVGRIHTRTVERDGQRMKMVEVEGQSVEVLRAPGPERGEPRDREPAREVFSDATDDIPF